MGSVCHERLWLEFGAFWGAQTLEILERKLFQKSKTREFPGFGRSETLRGVVFVGGSVARVWRVSGRSNTGNSRADEFLKFWITDQLKSWRCWRVRGLIMMIQIQDPGGILVL